MCKLHIQGCFLGENNNSMRRWYNLLFTLKNIGIKKTSPFTYATTAFFGAINL